MSSAARLLPDIERRRLRALVRADTVTAAPLPADDYWSANHDQRGRALRGAHATAGAVVTAETAAGPRRLWAMTPTTTFFCRRWRQRPQTAKRSERDRPLDDQAPAMVLSGGIVPFAATHCLCGWSAIDHKPALR